MSVRALYKWTCDNCNAKTNTTSEQPPVTWHRVSDDILRRMREEDRIRPGARLPEGEKHVCSYCAKKHDLFRASLIDC